MHCGQVRGASLVFGFGRGHNERVRGHVSLETERGTRIWFVMLIAALLGRPSALVFEIAPLFDIVNILMMAAEDGARVDGEVGVSALWSNSLAMERFSCEEFASSDGSL